MGFPWKQNRTVINQSYAPLSPGPGAHLRIQLYNNLLGGDIIVLADGYRGVAACRLRQKQQHRVKMTELSRHTSGRHPSGRASGRGIKTFQLELLDMPRQQQHQGQQQHQQGHHALQATFDMCDTFIDDNDDLALRRSLAGHAPYSLSSHRLPATHAKLI